MATLHPDLHDRVFDSDGLRVLHHPLIIDPLYVDNEKYNELVNMIYDRKRSSVEQAREEKDWLKYIFLHERPYRLSAFKEIQDQITDDSRFWKLVGTLWIDTDNAYEFYEDWMEIFGSDRKNRQFLMNDDERAAFAKMPDKIIVYRGVRSSEYEIDDAIAGLSWTVNQDTAEWFAKRFNSSHCNPYVIEGLVKKKDVIAYFTRRNEHEIIVMPEKVEVLNTIKLG